MKAIVQDVDAIHALRPLDVATYLVSAGWHKTYDYSDKAGLWEIDTAGQNFSLALPLKVDLADYNIRMAELLETVANVEQRSQLDVLRDLSTAVFDLIRVTASTSSQDGTLFINDGLSLVRSTRDMLSAAANAVQEKRPFYARRTQVVGEYLDRVRLGQTERGSYVLTLLSPVEPHLGPSQELPLAPTFEPYSRQVTRTLMQSLTALTKAAQQAVVDENMQPFVNAVDQGVSANLCEAVVGLSLNNNIADIDIGITWSRRRPAIEIPNIIRIPTDTIAIIKEAGRVFRETASFDDFELQGFVRSCERVEGATNGEVIIVGDVRGQQRKVYVQLETGTYNKAVDAHRDRSVVKCVGDLVKDGRSFRLNDARHFKIVETEEVN